MRQPYHKESEVSRQAGGRVNQKARTRAAIVAAAAALLRRGASPSVAAAADEAKVSRATAYRYFPSPEALLVEVAEMTPAVLPVEAVLRRPATDDAEERLLQLLDTFNPIVIAEEVAMRNALRVYLDTWLVSRRGEQGAPSVREGRRVRWLDEALVPVRRRVSKPQWQRLRAALSLTLGTEAVVVMKDVCRLENEEALAVLRWAATALLRASLDEARSTARQRKLERP
jgi:AcrR family transcriptional regulator